MKLCYITDAAIGFVASFALYLIIYSGDTVDMIPVTLLTGSVGDHRTGRSAQVMEILNL